MDWNDWLGYDNKFLPFEEAREIARNLNLKSSQEWNDWAKTKRPSNIPSSPHRTYKDQWKGWADFLGKEK